MLSGQTGVVFDWSYNQAALTTKLAAEDTEWKSFVPAGCGGGLVLRAGDQRRRPASRRSAAVAGVPVHAEGAEPLDQGRGQAGAVRRDGQGRHRSTRPCTGNLPKVEGTLVTLTDAQTTAANDYLKANWAAAVGS